MRHCGEHTHLQDKEEPRRARTRPRTCAPHLSANGIPFAPISQPVSPPVSLSVSQLVRLSDCSVWYHNSIKIYILLLNNLLVLFASIFMYFLYIYFPLGTNCRERRHSLLTFSLASHELNSWKALRQTLQYLFNCTNV